MPFSQGGGVGPWASNGSNGSNGRFFERFGHAPRGSPRAHLTVWQLAASVLDNGTTVETVESGKPPENFWGVGQNSRNSQIYCFYRCYRCLPISQRGRADFATVVSTVVKSVLPLSKCSYFVKRKKTQHDHLHRPPVGHGAGRHNRQAGGPSRGRPRNRVRATNRLVKLHRRAGRGW